MSAVHEAHLIEELDAMILRKSLRAIGQWQEEHGLIAPRVSVNMSSCGLADMESVDRIMDAISAAQVTRHRASSRTCRSTLCLISTRPNGIC